MVRYSVFKAIFFRSGSPFQRIADELNRLAANNTEVPGAMIQYLIGRYDFYKVITDDRHETTRVEAINIAGTLNRPSGRHNSIVDVPRLRLPTRFYHMGFKPGSDNTVEVVCDEGWTISMRIHNASSRIEPSLKFDVNLISLPGSIQGFSPFSFYACRADGRRVPSSSVGPVCARPHPQGAAGS